MNRSKIRPKTSLRAGPIFVLPAFLLVMVLVGLLTYNSFLLSNSNFPWYESPEAASILTILLLIFLACQLSTLGSSPWWPFDLQFQDKIKTIGSRASAYPWPGNLEETILSRKIMSRCA